MRQKVEYRGFEPDDLEAMFRLDEICFDPQFRFSRRAMHDFAKASNAYVLLAEVEDELAGFCLVHRETVRSALAAYIVTLDVAPRWRRHGIAAGLMQRAETAASLSGCVAMLLHVFTGNADAIRFYERQGYEAAGRDKAFYGVDSDGATIDALLYRKPLSSPLES